MKKLEKHPESQNQSLMVWPKIDQLPIPSQFEAYVKAAQRFPVLTEEEEAVLISKWRENKDKEAAKKLVLSHLRLVTKVVKDHAGYGLSSGDLAQEGTVGLMKAVQRFDPSFGVRLASYALLWIQAEIREFILLNWRMVKLSGASAKKLFFGYRKAHQALEDLGDDRLQKVSLDEMAKEMDVSSQDINSAETYFRGRDVSILPSSEENTSEKTRYPILSNQILASDVAVQDGDEIPSHLQTPESMLEQVTQSEYVHALLHQSLQKLPEREREVVLARRLQENPLGLQELGEKMGISAERVRQLENQGLSRLKQFLFETVKNSGIIESFV